MVTREAVRPVSRVPGLFRLSTDITNEYLKQNDRRLPAEKEYLWVSCLGAHMAALFVALDELLPYVLVANRDFTPYLARARNHAEAIDTAFRFRLAFLWRLNEDAGVDVGVVAGAGVAAKVSTSDGVRRLSSELLALCEATFRTRSAQTSWGSGPSIYSDSSSLTAQTLKSYAGKLSQFAEFCHDSENISPLEATTPTVVRFVEQAELIVSAPISEYQYNFRALVTSVVNFMFFATGLTGVSCRVASKAPAAPTKGAPHRHSCVLTIAATSASTTTHVRVHARALQPLLLPEQ
eukprot:jgi/Tetstr1/429129/TSEL_019091.t1